MSLGHPTLHMSLNGLALLSWQATEGTRESQLAYSNRTLSVGYVLPC